LEFHQVPRLGDWLHTHYWHCMYFIFL